MNLIEEPEVFYSKTENFPLKEETYKIIGLAMEVHRVLGKGFLEVVYKDALEIEFKNNNIPYLREVPYKIDYKGTILKRSYNADFTVFNQIILEIKAQSNVIGENYAQTINYLAASKLKVGLLLNFGEDSLIFKRVINS